MVTRDEVEKLSSLARIRMTPAEKKGIVADLEAILGYVSQLAEVETDSSTVETAPRRNVFREDGGAHAAAAHTKEVLRAAPKTENGFVVVKKILAAE